MPSQLASWSAPPPAAPPAAGAARAGVLGALALLALLTRWPLAGASWGESDGARYLLGLVQWVRYGPAAPMVYARVLSPGYYALAAWAVRQTGVGPQRLLDGLSVASAVLSAPLLYLLAGRFIRRELVMPATLLFLLSPAFWWLGIEPHPQGLSFLCLLTAWACLVASGRAAARRWLAEVAAAAAFAAGLLFKNDLVLLAPALVVLAWQWAPPAQRRRSLLGAALCLTVAMAAFVLLRPLLLGMGAERAQLLTTQAVLEFWSLPRGFALARQLLPLLTAPGLATTALILWGLARGLRRAVWRQRWLWSLAAWTLPGIGFWLLVRGNNVRHMVPYWLLPLWAALELLPVNWRTSHLLALAAVLLIGDVLMPPASSNQTLYPSGNVPVSQRDLAAKSAQLQRFAFAALVQAGSSGPCFLGNYTLPYAQLALLLARPGLRFVDGGPAILLTGGAVPARFLEVNSSADYRAAAAACPPAFSLEYSPQGQHRQFLGAELATAFLTRAALRRWPAVSR